MRDREVLDVHPSSGNYTDEGVLWPSLPVSYFCVCRRFALTFRWPILQAGPMSWIYSHCAFWFPISGSRGTDSSGALIASTFARGRRDEHVRICDMLRQE